jgi:uncharacterized protein involved in high-affinity Fe2+ transport
MSLLSILMSSTAAVLLAGSAAASAPEHPIGQPALLKGMEVAAVEPADIMRPAADSDIHLEADIHATAGNANGFAEGGWIPNLKIEYVLVRVDDNERIGGMLMPMVASDGPHYGDNVKLTGPGKYRLTFTIDTTDGPAHFGRHVDKETGVGPWPAPFTVDYVFTFAGNGKKSGYRRGPPHRQSQVPQSIRRQCPHAPA